MEIILLIVIFGQLGYLVFREVQHQKHLKDLELRLHARSLQEYEQTKQVEKEDEDLSKMLKDRNREEDEFNKKYIDLSEVSPEEALNTINKK